MTASDPNSSPEISRERVRSRRRYESGGEPARAGPPGRRPSSSATPSVPVPGPLSRTGIAVKGMPELALTRADSRNSDGRGARPPALRSWRPENCRTPASGGRSDQVQAREYPAHAFHPSSP